jgi:hypothetical protein
MKTKKLTKKTEAALLRKFGTLKEVSYQLGITRQRYHQIRKRGEKLNRRLLIIIDSLLKED